MRLLYVWLVFCSATIFGLLHHVAYHKSSAVPRDTLVIYLYHPTDVEHKNNLLYFLKAGVQAQDNCQYAIVIAPQVIAATIKIRQLGLLEYHPTSLIMLLSV
jgi:hypothetical protein